MTLTSIPLSLLPLYIDVAFMDDEDLDKYHIHNGTRLEQMHHTFETIKKAANKAELTCYAVDKIGFTVLIEPQKILYSFGINKRQRTAENLKKWFEEIKSILTTFECVLWTKNTRAIKHLVKQGMTIANVADKYTLLTYGQCQ